jgi:hypothetical protein
VWVRVPPSAPQTFHAQIGRLGRKLWKMPSTSGSNTQRGDVAYIRDRLRSYRNRLGMHTVRSTFAEACALVIGLDDGVPEPFVGGFQTWLVARNPELRHVAFPDLVLREAGVDGKGGRSELTASENVACVQALFDLLETYLAAAGGDE